MDAADGSAASATAKLWSATAASVPFARDEADAFADALAARCLSFPDRRDARLETDAATPGARADASARRVLAESRLALDAFFAHADALAETAPAFLGAAARRRVCERAALKNCLEKLLFEATAASALDARAGGAPARLPRRRRGRSRRRAQSVRGAVGEYHYRVF